MEEKKQIPNKNTPAKGHLAKHIAEKGKGPSYLTLKLAIAGIILAFILYRIAQKVIAPDSHPNNTAMFASRGLPKQNVAYVVAEEMVRNKLNPSGPVEFKSTPADYMQTSADSTYKIRSYVDSEKQPGVKTRNSFIINMKFKGGDKFNSSNWELISLDFEVVN